MRFKELSREIRYDLKIDGVVNFKFLLSSFLFNPSFRLLLNYRIGKYLYSKQYKICNWIANIFRVKQITKRNCYISFNAKIGKGVRFPHPLGIVIGDKVQLGNGITIWQQVTLGSHGKGFSEQDYPIIENNVKIFAGAKVIGKVIIGENAIIGANAVVFKDVPPNCSAVGIPARIIYPENK